MKICGRGLNWIQVCDENGLVNVCCWRGEAKIGNLLQDSFYDIYHGKTAQKIRTELINGDYSGCRIEYCPFLANNCIDKHCVDISHIPEYPDTISLSYEGKCNYKCTCCSSHDHMMMEKERDWSDNINKIESELRKVLPYIKRISAHGRGELFVSPSIMNLLGEWKPLANPEECFVELETNGSLFNEKNWGKIANLGKYHVSVYITIMSFEEGTYQYLSGTTLPLENIIKNLYFVKRLREQGIINHVELATVVQERNFREMPSFVSRCLDEFAADTVRLRSIFVSSNGPLDHNVAWFSDVRNPYHPYYKEYLRVMSDPIFSNPKVYKWSGDLDSSLGEHPGIEAERQLKELKIKYDEALIRSILPKLKGKNIIIYGAGVVGQMLAKAILEEKNLYGKICFAETVKSSEEKNGLSINKLSDLIGMTNSVVVIAVREYYRETMLNYAKSLGFRDIMVEDF